MLKGLNALGFLPVTLESCLASPGVRRGGRYNLPGPHEAPAQVSAGGPLQHQERPATARQHLPEAGGGAGLQLRPRARSDPH
eukprot:scaffold652233_cov52-Prasinocladus_malaysianus.AAC.1